ncbi:hypothetical protein A2U01_0063198, partial [Trifolium medium]|nr:hypothetical protein [Trifolium medium]
LGILLLQGIVLAPHTLQLKVLVHQGSILVDGFFFRVSIRELFSVTYHSVSVRVSSAIPNMDLRIGCRLVKISCTEA